MRIVVAHESVGTEGGVETYLLSAIRGLRHRGHHIALVYYARSETESHLRSSAHVALGVEERGIDAVLGKLHEWRPDVCFSHNMGPLEVDRQLLARWPRRQDAARVLRHVRERVEDARVSLGPGVSADVRAGVPRALLPAALRPAFCRRDGERVSMGERAACPVLSLCRDGRGESSHERRDGTPRCA